VAGAHRRSYSSGRQDLHHLQVVKTGLDLLGRVAETGPDLQLVRVLRWPAESDTKRTGERCLDNTCVRARVPDGVAPPRTQRARRRPTHRGCADRHQYTGHAGGDEIQGVIEPGRGPTESLVTGRTVADHRVEGVGTAVDQQRRYAADGRP